MLVPTFGLGAHPVSAAPAVTRKRWNRTQAKVLRSLHDRRHSFLLKHRGSALMWRGNVPKNMQSPPHDPSGPEDQQEGPLVKTGRTRGTSRQSQSRVRARGTGPGGGGGAVKRWVGVAMAPPGPCCHTAEGRGAPHNRRPRAPPVPDRAMPQKQKAMARTGTCADRAEQNNG